MVIAPKVDVGTAVLVEEPPPMLTVSPVMVYVYIMPFTVSVAAWIIVAAIRKIVIVITFFIFISPSNRSSNRVPRDRHPVR